MKKEKTSKKILKWWQILLIVVGVIVLLIGLLIGSVIFSVFRQAKINEENQIKMQKSDELLIGTRMSVPREGKDAVSVNIYYPESMEEGEKLPAVLNIHGGAFITGDADTLDSQSQRLADSWGMVIIGVDYTLANNVAIEYAVEEVRDTVLYFVENGSAHGIDPSKIVLMGYSAGGYHAMAAAIELEKQGVELAAQVLCYPYLRDVLDIYNALPEEDRLVAPALFVIAETDPISQGALPYEQLLRDNSVQTEILTYADAMHGFIEENNPEYDDLQNITSQSPEQETLARKAEDEIGQWLNAVLQQ